ncbi:MAG: amidohydrolase family protein, partial [Bacteroidota bacterium]
AMNPFGATALASESNSRVSSRSRSRWRVKATSLCGVCDRADSRFSCPDGCRTTPRLVKMRSAPFTVSNCIDIAPTLFDEGWQEEMGITYQDIQWEATGERLTEATFQTYRERGGTVIIHMMKPEWIVKGIQDERTMIGSDGMPYAPGAHPRTAGTFSRVLGRYVREQKVIGLMEALRKMTIMPAQRLEAIAPMMRSKGRLQVGVDADITIFDPTTIIDKADFKGLKYSEGVQYVLINGQLVVENQQIRPNVFPGEAIVSKYRR